MSTTPTEIAALRDLTLTQVFAVAGVAEVEPFAFLTEVATVIEAAR